MKKKFFKIHFQTFWFFEILHNYFRQDFCKILAKSCHFRQNTAYLNRLPSNKHGQFVWISRVKLDPRISWFSHAFRNQHDQVIYFIVKIQAIWSDNGYCAYSNARFATSNDAHFQEHDLRSRGFATVFLYEIFHAWIRLSNTACIRYAPFIKVRTVFRIVLICVTIVSASVTACTEAD